MIQETNINLKLFSLINLEQNNYTKPNVNNMPLPPQNMFINQQNTQSNTNITNTNTNIQSKSIIDIPKAPQLFLNSSELIARKSALNKITISDNKVITTNEIASISLSDIKNQLKRVDTDERCLLTHLKKEHEDNISNIDNKVLPIKKKKKKVKIDLEKEFDELVNNNS
jgi:hypothetical protein